MSYEVLARAYRPQRFDEVVGQEHITRTLTRSFQNDRLGHAYIFSGPRGIGKTTTARLLAKLVNCDDPEDAEPCNQCESCERIASSQSVDVMEIDGASNNSVDQVRDLRENVQYAPANNEKKVYIIDEVHMLSKSAFNALLKTLEEPPEHVIFIFATTEVENVPDTILSRCQRYDFQLIPVQQLVDSLREICEQEDIPAEDEALFLIARFAEGSLRDAQSILDQMINFTGAGEETLTGDRVSETWGLAPYDELLTYLRAVRDNDPDVAVERLHEHVSDGKDLTSLIADLSEMVRNLTLLSTEPDSDYLDKAVPGEVLDELRSLSDSFTRTELNWMFEQMIDLHERVRQNSRFQLQLAEVGLIRIIEGRPKYNLSEIVDRLESLEGESVPSGNGESPSAQPASTGSRTESGTTTESSGDASDGSTEPDPGGEGELDTSDGVGDPDQRRSTGDDPEDENHASSSTPAEETDAQSEPQTSEVPDGELADRILKNTGQPAQAYLRESESIRRQGDEIIVTFRGKWSNHAENLDREEPLDQLREAIRCVVDEQLAPVIQVTDDDSGDSSPPRDESNAPARDTSESNQSDDGERLLEQTMDVFEVDEVEKIDDS